MHTRYIRPTFFLNEELAELPYEFRLLFIGLWCAADRDGRLEDRPRRIKAAVFPYDDVDVECGLTALAEKGFIIRYEVEGRQYIQVVNFTKHQRVHHTEKPSTIPEVPANWPVARPNRELTVSSPLADGGLTPLKYKNKNITTNVESSRELTPPARSIDPKTAQGLVGYYVDTCRDAGLAVTSADKGRIGRYIKEVLSQGIPDYQIKAAIERMVEKRLGPHLLAQLCNEVEARARPSPEEHEQLVRDMLAKVRSTA